MKMKRSLKPTALLSCFLIVATLLQPIYAAEQVGPNDAFQPSEDTPAPPSPDEPTADPLFDTLYEGIDQVQTLITYDSPDFIPDSQLQETVNSLFDECPEFFYLDLFSRSYTAYYDSASGALLYVRYEFEPVYTMAQDKITAAKADWEAQLSDILTLVTPEMSDLEKALILHDYLCTRFSYDTSLEIHDSYTFLQEKRGVCEAYAATYAALLTRLNIPNGFAKSEEMMHIWNVVQIDGEWYHVDISLDDPLDNRLRDQPGKALHTNFLRSDAGITETGHTSWTADVVCTSTKYEQSFLAELVSGVVTDQNSFYGVSNQQNAILRCDFDTMTAQKFVDLSAEHWRVWDDDAFYNACYSNLYCDGEWLYYSTPLSVEALNLESGESRQVFTYDKGDGYLYAMQYDRQSGQLVCAVSTHPGGFDSEFRHGTTHGYQTTAEGILSHSVCSDCAHEAHRIAPPEGEAFGVAASARPTPQKDGFHDIRISFAVSLDAIYSLGMIDYTFSLQKADGLTETLTLHSQNDHFDDFLIYDELSANGKLYTADENHLLLGFFVSEIPDQSWTDLSFTVKQSSDGEILYTGSLSYDQLIAPESEL